jgi:indolepyruvate decarboxylase
MLPQVLSTLARFKKPALLFVFNNSLYGIEQYLVDNTFYAPGGTRPPEFFNRLAAWNYVKLAEAFGALGFRATTTQELDAALAQVASLKDVPALVDVELDPKDLPAEIRATVAAAAGLVSPRVGTVIAPAAFN